jgi:hypothetical protein
MDTFEQITLRIVEDQENIIGPLAREEALRISGISFVNDGKDVSLSGDKRHLIDQVVARYEHLFGKASVQVCRDAAAPFLPSLKTGETPISLT